MKTRRKIAVGGPLWRCGKCGPEFANRNQTHTCGTLDFEHHFAGRPSYVRSFMAEAYRVGNQEPLDPPS